ncbi:MAG: ABC transporter permease [Bacteroides sp.]|nr:ABC transporter permease [Bacteroides sp.]
MIRYYFKQMFILFRDNPLLSMISVLGSALAISVLMVILIVMYAKVAEYEPEIHRHRTLYVRWGSAVKKDDPSHHNNWRLSLYDVREAFYPLQTPEAVTATYDYGSVLVSRPGVAEEFNNDLLYTDAAFWQVFRFRFLAGAPYDQAVVDAGLKQAVISRQTALHLYGGVEEAVGQCLQVNFVEYTVVGVVRDVNRFAEYSYAEIWVPYTSNSMISQVTTVGWGEGHSGNYQCFILACSISDFPAIRQEITASVARMNSQSVEFDLNIKDQPHSFYVQFFRKYITGEEAIWEKVARLVIILLIILLVPAVNLSGIIQGSVTRRLSEWGIRRAFGACRWDLWKQVVRENFMFTLLGGVVGLGLSYLAIWSFSGWLLRLQWRG